MKEKLKEKIIKKWEESGFLDGLSEMDKEHPILRVIELNGKKYINEFPNVKSMADLKKLNKKELTDE